MFEDIINKKFVGVEIGTRDIASEIRTVIMMGADFAISEIDGSDDNAIEMIKLFFDKYLDELVQMHLSYFEPKELLEMLTFEMSEAAKKKLRFQVKIQQFMGEKLFDLMDKMDQKELEGMKDAEEGLKLLVNDWAEEQELIWDSKEGE